MTYNELLNSDEWHSKRIEILARDSNCCSNCKRTETVHLKNYPNTDNYIYFDYSQNSIIKVADPEFILNGILHEIDLSDLDPAWNVKTSNHPIYLQVHHKYYIRNRLPWD